MTSIIKVNNLQNQCGANTINKCGTAITVGASGDTVTLAAGASQSGFGQTYSAVSWDTTPKTGLFTAVSGVGYFCNTTSAPFTVTLPAGTAGDIVAFADYAATWQTNAVTVTPNGTDKIGSVNTSVSLITEGQSVTFVFVDSTQGWINTMDSTSNVRGNPNLTATVSGACNTLVTAPCCANVKIATFTGPGSFTVTSAAVCAANNVVSYMVVAGGAAGGSPEGGGGGAGGFREYKSTVTPYTASPLDGNPGGTAVTVSAQAYAIVVGGGGTAVGPTPISRGNPGNVSSFSTITSAGGGGGAAACNAGSTGGSGGGSQRDANSPSTQAGNTPSVSPPQGNNGGSTPGTSWHGAGGGGGAGAVGGNGSGDGGPGGETGGSGGAGVTTSISASSTTYGGGGGGSINGVPGGGGGSGGSGGGGGGSSPSGPAPSNAIAGTVNTGGGGGGGTGKVSGAGGSGIVIIRYKFQ